MVHAALKYVINETLLVCRSKVNHCILQYVLFRICLKLNSTTQSRGLFLSAILNYRIAEPSVKVFSANVSGRTYIIIWIGAIRESFLCKILVLYQNENVFSLKGFPLYGIPLPHMTPFVLSSIILLFCVMCFVSFLLG